MATIKRATLGDAQRIAELFDDYRQFYEMPPNPDLALSFIYNRLKNSEATIFAAERASDIIGFCQIYPSFCSVHAAPICILSDLFVKPSSRGSGAGSRLLEAAEAFARQTGAVRITLQTATTNHLAQGIYEAKGWIRNTTLYGYAKRLA